MQISYSEEKNRILKETRGVCFNDVVDAIERGFLLDDRNHHNPTKYINQRVMVVKMHGYVYLVPYVKEGKNIFLKTAYPSSSANKVYNLKKEPKNE